MSDEMMSDPLGVKWGPHMSVGVQRLDTDHEEIISVLNELVAAVDRQDAAAKSIFTQLMEVVEGHFQREERVMAACGFDGLEYHAREHRKIRDRLLEIGGKELESADRTVRAEVRDFLTHWLYGHVLVDDFAYRGVFQDGDSRVTAVLEV